MSSVDLTKVYQKIESYRTEMVSSLSELISIPSVAVRTPGPDPFGPEVQRAYAYMLAKAGQGSGAAPDDRSSPAMNPAQEDAAGSAAEPMTPIAPASPRFRTFDADHFGGHIDYPGGGDGIMGILGHLDVVPAGDTGQWDFDPFGGEVIDGFVCGRGSMDDKGPVIAAFYAMKALQDCGYRPARTVRMILGLDEETDWDGMRHYLAFVPDRPDCGFTPDADFPVVRGEMGILVFDLARKFSRSRDKGLQLRLVQGGSAANSVPDSARAVIYDDSGAGYDEIRSLLTDLRESTGWKLNFRGVGKSLEIRTTGVAAHGAKPQQGMNAISMLMQALGCLRFASDDITEFIRFYNDHIGFDLHGEQMGCAIEDAPSGRLIWNTGMIDLNRGSVRLTINVRYPVTADESEVYDGIGKVIAPYELGIIKGVHKPPVYFPADDPMVTGLMDIYRRHTGDTSSQPLIIGGGTYARAMEGILAFGARFPGGPELGHQKNERIAIEDLILLARIYAEAIVCLAGEAAPAGMAGTAGTAETAGSLPAGGTDPAIPSDARRGLTEEAAAETKD